MAEAQLQQFLEKVRQLNAFVALSEAEPSLRQALRDCIDHHAVVALAQSRGFEIGRRWVKPSLPAKLKQISLLRPALQQGRKSASFC